MDGVSEDWVDLRKEEGLDRRGWDEVAAVIWGGAGPVETEGAGFGGAEEDGVRVAGWLGDSGDGDVREGGL